MRLLIPNSSAQIYTLTQRAVSFHSFCCQNVNWPLRISPFAFYNGVENSQKMPTNNNNNNNNNTTIIGNCTRSLNTENNVKMVNTQLANAESFLASHQQDLNSRVFRRQYFGRMRRKMDRYLARRKEKSLVEQIIREAAAVLYVNCSDHFDYMKLIKHFGLDDVMVSWVNLTILHIWIVLMRCHHSLNPQAYLQLRDMLINSLHHDMDEKYKELKEEFDKSFNTKENAKTIQALLLTAFFEYDEGILTDDKALAAAIWKCLHMRNEAIDLVHLNNAVHYVRKNVAELQKLHVDSVLVDGVKQWKL